ncbi:MAG TPA: polyketide synthase dehydratase domain-containing protein, partial [Kofleriaceae bacterium]|nr:polyketide synthase dehydratase domain-containing protein [Kofleriaceae bacterium]
PAGQVMQALAEVPRRLSLAADNGPERCVVAGLETELLSFCGELERRGIASRRLAVSHAFHSALMDPALDELEGFAAGLAHASPHLPFVTCLGGELVSSADWPRHWRRHAREPVAFAAGARAAIAAGCDLLLEIGPSPVLLALAQELPELGDRPLVPLLRRGGDDLHQLTSALAELHVRGVPVRWRAFYESQGSSQSESKIESQIESQDSSHAEPHAGGQVQGKGHGKRRTLRRLPSYPFQREPYWPAESADQPPAVAAPPGGMGPTTERCFTAEVSGQLDAALGDHLIYGRVVVPASYHLVNLLRGLDDERGLGDRGPAGAARPFALAELTFTSAVVLEPGDHRTLRYQVSGGPGHGALRVDSYDLEEPPSAGREGASDGASFGVDVHGPELHAQGALAAAVAVSPAPLSELEALSAREPEVTAEAFYQGFARVGVALGPTFRWVESVYVDEASALARFRPAREGEHQGAVIPAGLLDSLFQVLGAAAGRTAADLVHVPAHLERIQLLGAYDGGATWGRAVLRMAQAGVVVGDLTLYAQDGAPLLEVVGLTVRAAPLAL